MKSLILNLMKQGVDGSGFKGGGKFCFSPQATSFVIYLFDIFSKRRNLKVERDCDAPCPDPLPNENVFSTRTTTTRLMDDPNELSVCKDELWGNSVAPLLRDTIRAPQPRSVLAVLHDEQDAKMIGDLLQKSSVPFTHLEGEELAACAIGANCTITLCTKSSLGGYDFTGGGLGGLRVVVCAWIDNPILVHRTVSRSGASLPWISGSLLGSETTWRLKETLVRGKLGDDAFDEVKDSDAQLTKKILTTLDHVVNVNQ